MILLFPVIVCNDAERRKNDDGDGSFGGDCYDGNGIHEHCHAFRFLASNLIALKEVGNDLLSDDHVTHFLEWEEAILNWVAGLNESTFSLDYSALLEPEEPVASF